MTKIPHSFPDLNDEDFIAVKQCLDHQFVGWDENLEEALSGYIRKFVLKQKISLTPSGSMALLVALKALGVKEGDHVLMPAISCWSVYNAIQFAGAVPVIYDVRGHDDFRSHFEAIAAKRTDRTKTVVATHMFGVLVEEKTMFRIKEELKLSVIEDYASSFGARYNNNLPVGQHSDFVIGSFASTKPVTAGAGGFIAGDNTFLSDAHEKPEGLAAINCRISRLNQGLLERQFARFEKSLTKKRKLKELYAKFVRIFGYESEGLYRAITFDDTGELSTFFKDAGFALDMRESVQPNLARELKLRLPNAEDFHPYISLPFHTKFVDALETKGIL